MEQGTCRDLGRWAGLEKWKKRVGHRRRCAGLSGDGASRGTARVSQEARGKRWACHCAAGSRHGVPLSKGDMTDGEWRSPRCAEGKAGLGDKSVRRTWLLLSR